MQITKMNFRIALSSLFLAGISLFAGDTSKAADKPTEAVPAKTAEAPGIGAWTTDYPAALKVAKERKLPMFLQFTGSDWCGWCQWMEGACLSKPEFLEAMRDQCVLVVIDFPQKTKLPDALKAQNTELSAKFKKAGNFPVYKMVDYDGETIFWWFGADPKYCQKADGVKRLVNDIKEFCSGSEGSIERAVKGAPPEKAAAYRAAAKEYRAVQLDITAWFDKDKKGMGKAEIHQEFQDFEKRLKVMSGKMAAIANP